MDTVLLAAILAFVIIVIAIVLLQRTHEFVAPPSSIESFTPSTKSPRPASSWGYVQDSDDLEFERIILSALPMEQPIERTFYTKVAGVSFQNDDGSSRVSIIKTCAIGQMMRIEWEPENKFDPNALAVFSEHGQIGYLPARLAGELVRDTKRNGARHVFIFRRPTRRDDGGAVVGAVLFIVRFEPVST